MLIERASTLSDSSKLMNVDAIPSSDGFEQDERLPAIPFPESPAQCAREFVFTSPTIWAPRDGQEMLWSSTIQSKPDTARASSPLSEKQQGKRRAIDFDNDMSMPLAHPVPKQHTALQLESDDDSKTSLSQLSSSAEPDCPAVGIAEGRLLDRTTPYEPMASSSSSPPPPIRKDIASISRISVEPIQFPSHTDDLSNTALNESQPVLFSSSPPHAQQDAQRNSISLPTQDQSGMLPNGGLGRSLRQRNAKQLNPYTLDQAKYTYVLNKQDWQDAVVPLKMRHEADSAILAAKKQAALAKGQDDLGGWLELEKGMQMQTNTEDPDYAYITTEKIAVVAKVKKRKRSGKEKRDKALRKALTGRSDSSSADNSASGYETNGSGKELLSPFIKPAKFGLSKKQQFKRKQRAGSEPVSSPQRQDDSAIEIDGDSSLLKCGQVPRSKQRSRSAANASYQAQRAISLDNSTEEGSSSASDSSGRASREAKRKQDTSASPVPLDRYTLDHTKKKALKGMMPGVFFKKAQADLELMKEERYAGRQYPELYDRGSADEESDESTGEENHDYRHRAVVRRRSVDNCFDFRLQGDTESELELSGEDDCGEPEDDLVTTWLGKNAPKRDSTKNRQRGAKDLIDKMLCHQNRSKYQRKDRAVSKARRHVLQERQNERDWTGNGIRPNKEKKKKRKKTIHSGIHTYSLADDDTLFSVPTFSHPTYEADRHQGGPVAITDGNTIPSVDFGTGRIQTANPFTNKWSNFHKFSYDFGIETLPARVSFENNSYIGKGHLYTFLQFLRDPRQNSAIPEITFPFGIQLDTGMSSDNFIDLLPRLCDNIVDQANTFSREEITLLDSTEACEVLRFAGIFLASQSVDTTLCELCSAIQTQFDYMERRIGAFIIPAVNASTFALYRLPMQWAFLNLVVRMHVMAMIHDISNDTIPAIEFTIRRLVKALLTYGLNRSGKALKTIMTPDNTLIKDASLQTWTCLVNMCLNQSLVDSVPLPNERMLWDIVESEMARQQDIEHGHPIMLAETNAYLAMFLCAMSQISPSGTVLPKARLKARWSVITNALEPVSVEGLQEHTIHQSNADLARRDGYVWTLAARCLIFVHRWHWPLDSKESLLPRLYDIINARSFKNLSIDGARDFPNFIQNYNRQICTDLEPRQDSTFHLFLKLLIVACKDKAAANQHEHERHCNRLIMRVMPLKRNIPYTRNVAILDTDRSMLANLYSLFLTFVIVSPLPMSKRLVQFKSFLSFEDADDLARPIIIRAIMYFAVIFRQHDLELSSIIDWFSSICTYLRAQYAEVEKRRCMQQSQGKTTVKGMSAISNYAQKEKESKDLANQQFRIAVSFTMILRAWQNIMLAKADDSAVITYPDVSWLNCAWTSAIFDSPIAQDPLIGVEALKCVQCFLNLRNRSLRSLSQGPVSQDEYVFDDLDFNDPALNDLIGYDNPATTSVIEEKRRQDTAFADLVKFRLSPSIFKLLSAIYTPDLTKPRSAPIVTQSSQSGTDYVFRVVQTWVNCAAVLVDNHLRTWDNYIIFGDETYKRIAEPVGRSEVGMLLGCALSDMDQSAFLSFITEFSGIWLENMVARKLTSQHVFTNKILNATATKNALFGGILPGRLDGSELYDFTIESLRLHRVAVLEVIFRNVGSILSGRAPAAEIVPPKESLFSWVNGLLGRMRDNLESFGVNEQAGKVEYTLFCKNILEKIKENAGPRVNENTVSNLRLFGGLYNNTQIA